MVRFFGSRARLNFPADVAAMATLTPPIWIISRAKENEHWKAEVQLASEHVDADLAAMIVEEVPELLSENLAYFRYMDDERLAAARLHAKREDLFEDLTDELEDEDEMAWSRPTANDHEAGPSGGERGGHPHLLLRLGLP